MKYNTTPNSSSQTQGVPRRLVKSYKKSVRMKYRKHKSANAQTKFKN